MQRDKKEAANDHQIVKRGTDLVDWIDLHRIRATFPQVAQTLYRLKSNRFPLWNWAAQDTSCPNPGRTRSEHATASHVFWTCPAAQRHWQHLRAELRSIAALDDEDPSLWIFALELPEMPNTA